MPDVNLGVDFAAPPADLPSRLATLRNLGASLLLTPLAHPRFRRDHRRKRDEPMTGSDLQLNSAQWGRHVIGKVSPWLQMDSPHDAIRRRAEEAFKQEIAWAAHLGLQAVLLPPPSPSCANYARLVQWACSSTQHMRFLVRVPIAAPPAVVDETSATDDDRADAKGPWGCWDRLRTLCEQSERLGVALELGMELPSSEAELERWFGEPIAMLLLPTATFLTNKRGYPALPRKHQATFNRLVALKTSIVVSGREDGRTATSVGGGSQSDGGAAGGAADEGISAHLKYMAYLLTKVPPLSETEQFESPYYDYLQAPLQPLADDLESSTYETFEQDPVKYKQYQAAVRAALTERHTADGPPAVVMVLGAGRGPLVAASLAAAEEAQRPIRVFAVDKNANAIVTLQNRVRNEPLWAAHVTVCSGDMREWAAPVAADIIVSELLGSWGDNELSPECLDGAMRYLKPSGISIPVSYVSTVAPLSSSKLWNEVRGLRELKHFETPYVVKVHNGWRMSDSQKLFYFEHPGEAAVGGEGGEPPDNTRAASLSFTLPVGGRVHGFVGYFHSTLYTDRDGNEIAISTDPFTESVGMFSWFPLYLPLRHPVLVPDGGSLAVQFWRHVSSHKVWYEWALLQPQLSPIHNPLGRSYYIGL